MSFANPIHCILLTFGQSATVAGNDSHALPVTDSYPNTCNTRHRRVLRTGKRADDRAPLERRARVPRAAMR